MTIRTLLLALLIVVAFCDKDEDGSAVPQDCKWSDWVDHGCSGTCGEHVMRTKKRIKLQEAANGGQRCRGATKRVMPCNLPKCDDVRIPDDFEYPDDLDIVFGSKWSDFTEWTPCTHSCGLLGKQQRKRACTKYKIQRRVQSQFPGCEGLAMEERSCNRQIPCPANTLNTERACCYALTAECLSCAAGMELKEYCKQNPDISGCKVEDFDANNLIPDRSNARIDYKVDEDIDSYPIGNVGSGQREGKDLELTPNTCSPNCQSCKAKDSRATSEWCLLECNNVGAPRCLSSWCECY